jgi:hypothetical protein
MSAIGSYLAFTDFLKQFYPTFIKSYTPSGKTSIGVFIDGDEITGVLSDTFILRGVTPSDSPEQLQKLPTIIGLTPEDTTYLKKLASDGSDGTGVAVADGDANGGTRDKFVFHRGELALDELVLLNGSVADVTAARAGDIFLGRKAFIENTIKNLVSAWRDGSILKRLVKYYSRVAGILSDVSLTERESDKIMAIFDGEREFVATKLTLVRDQISLLRENPQRLSLLNATATATDVSPRLTVTADSGDDEDDGDGGYADLTISQIIEQLLRRLEHTREGFVRTIEDRIKKQNDMASIRLIFRDYAKIQDNIHDYHLNMTNAIEQLPSEASFGYNAIRNTTIGDARDLFDKFNELRNICKDYPSHFDKSECARLEQYLGDYKNTIIKNLNEQISKLNTKKESLENTRESRRLKAQDEIRHIKDILRQKIQEVETLVDLNRNKINTYRSEVTKDKLYNYAACTGVSKYYKQVRGILQRTQIIFKKCEDLLDVLCSDTGAVRIDLFSTLSQEQKEEHCSTLEKIRKSFAETHALFEVTGVADAGTGTDGEIDIETCTKMSDYLLVWIGNAGKLEEIHSDLEKLLSNLY